PVLLAAMLPVSGGAVFLWLLAPANPGIEKALASLHLPDLDLGRAGFWFALTIPAWAVLPPPGLELPFSVPAIAGAPDMPGAAAGSVGASLVVFNVLFAIQNGLDIAYLWSGAGLPAGMSLAAYAQRGAHPRC